MGNFNIVAQSLGFDHLAGCSCGSVAGGSDGTAFFPCSGVARARATIFGSNFVFLTFLAFAGAGVGCACATTWPSVVSGGVPPVRLPPGLAPLFSVPTPCAKTRETLKNPAAAIHKYRFIGFNKGSRTPHVTYRTLKESGKLLNWSHEAA